MFYRQSFVRLRRVAYVINGIYSFDRACQGDQIKAWVYPLRALTLFSPLQGNLDWEFYLGHFAAYRAENQ